MATIHDSRQHHRARDTVEVLRAAFWVFALGVIAVFAFFAGLGAISFGDALGVSIAVVVLAVLWVLHAMLERRHREEIEHDPRLHRQQQRRGF